MSLSCASAFVKFYSLTGSKLPDLEVQNDLNRNPETSEHFSEIRRAEERFLSSPAPAYLSRQSQ